LLSIFLIIAELRLSGVQNDIELGINVVLLSIFLIIAELRLSGVFT